MRKLSRFIGVATACLLLSTAAARAAEPGLFLGADLGVAQPTNNNFRQHVQIGMTGEPFVGYQFNKYIGLMTQMHINAWPPDDDNRRFYQKNFGYENQWTTMWALTAGPRFSLPVFDDLVDLHVGAQGGGYKAMGGRMNQWAPGFQVGGGIDYNISPNWAVGAFGRWNRAYMSPHPYELLGPKPAPPENQGPADAQWATAGISVKYTFAEEAAAPPPPPPPPPPPAAAPPMKKKIVLRSVNFDFDKYNIRADAAPILDEAIKVLKAEPESVGVIAAGYTDSVGSEAYNMALSIRRAEAVRNYLVKGGISPKRIKVEGFGESNPVASNATADGRAQNRRTELRLY